MPWDLNVVMVVGRLTRDPELSYTKENVPMCRFSVANNRGNQEGDVNFFEVVAWNKTAEVVNQVLRKGSQVAIEGKLKQNKFQDKTTGQMRSGINIIASSVQFLGGRPGGGDGEAQSGGASGGYGERRPAGGGYGDERPSGGGYERPAPRGPAAGAPAQGGFNRRFGNAPGGNAPAGDDIQFEKFADDMPPGGDDEVPF